MKSLTTLLSDAINYVQAFYARPQRLPDQVTPQAQPMPNNTTENLSPLLVESTPEIQTPQKNHRHTHTHQHHKKKSHQKLSTISTILETEPVLELNLETKLESKLEPTLEMQPHIEPEIQVEIQPEIEKPTAAVVPLFNAIQEKAFAINGKNIAETPILEAQGENTGEIPTQILRKPHVIDHTGFDDELYQMAMIINGANIRRTPKREQYGKKPGF